MARWTSAVSLALVATALSACNDDGGGTEPQPPVDETPAALGLGLYGLPAPVAAGLTSAVETVNADTETRQVTVTGDGSASLREAVAAGEPLPDLFFASSEDLAWLDDADLLEPVDSYLQARELDFGDGFSFDGVRAFTVNDRLLCMPYAIDPLVVYYNPALVDFEAMAAQGLDTPNGVRWTLEEFEAAAAFASDPVAGTKGVHVAPTLDQLSPFVLSGGGQVFEDAPEPTSLALSQEGTVEALVPILSVLRQAAVTLTPEELAQADPLEWFTGGRLGMMIGPRSLVPQLRAVEGLQFEVMMTPEVGERATVGTADGICVSAGSENVEAAADTIVDLVSADAMTPVAETGYFVPSNVEVAESDAYLQPEAMPLNSSVFFDALRYTTFLPPVPDRAALDAAVEPYLEDLLNLAILNPDTIEAITGQIDEESQLVLGGTPAEE
ncbi:extracellular solute-binding protein [Nocardioides sp. ChNu-153]|uniref:extracellular solute-binding protein n=1 Tax=unclassified Nocardioides TaxID=2615069 RepID=UPI002407196F|nr:MULTISPECIES: extracellular solute-binding protein [unclassified Nocardioides]MDF9716287.1 extracellular solute-binding protein [Nocardioides sp. ChNu-99]MDN7122751.1 extracellular solute-binding protein [Nocardioides sp. ChNu-153]